MFLITGLGNPGPEYQNNRHNIGFQVIDQIANQKPLSWEKKFHSEIAFLTLPAGKVILQKPLTFMNNSGQAILQALSFYKIASTNLLVIYDEIDFPLGTCKLLNSGGPGTHNGMKSIVQAIGKNFKRLRFGIESRGNSAPRQQDLASFVLSDFSAAEQQILNLHLPKAAEAALLSISDMNRAMNYLHSSKAS